MKTLILPDPGVVSPKTLKAARKVWAAFKGKNGFRAVATAFGSKPTDNSKYGKGKALIYGLSLAPSRLSGYNVCRWSTPVCVRGCVAYNGNGNYPMVVKSRIVKTRFLFEHPNEAAVLLAHFLDSAVEAGRVSGKPVGIRLNTFSDIDWQYAASWIFVRYPTLHFYDYTKDWSRGVHFDNYSLTYSASERTSDADICKALTAGFNVAVVFSTSASKPLPDSWNGFTVVNGDASDERWLDPKGVVVGLRAKGKMRTMGGDMVRQLVGAGN